MVLRDKQWFQTTTVTTLVPEKHHWRSEFNTVLQCTPAQTLFFVFFLVANIVHICINVSCNNNTQYKGTCHNYIVVSESNSDMWVQYKTLATSTNLVHFTVNACKVQTPYIQDVNGLYSIQSAAVHPPWCTPDCNFWPFGLSSLALQSCTWMYACSMVVYMYMETYSWNGHMHAVR